MPKAKKKKKQHIRKSFLIVGLLVLVGVALIIQAFFVPKNKGLAHSPMSDEDLAEMQNNTIPSDVQAMLQKDEAVLGAQSSDTAQTFYPPKSIHVPILMYHYVEYVQDVGDTIRISLNTTPDILEAKIKTLQHAGYVFMTNAELADVLDGKRFLPQNRSYSPLTMGIGISIPMHIQFLKNTM